MIVWRRENWFDDDFQSRRNQFFGFDSASFVLDGDDLPVDVLFSTFVTTASVDVTLPVSFTGSVLDLSCFGGIGAVGPLLAPTTYFGGKYTKIETEGAVHDGAIHFLIWSKHIGNNQLLKLEKINHLQPSLPWSYSRSPF